MPLSGGRFSGRAAQLAIGHAAIGVEVGTGDVGTGEATSRVMQEREIKRSEAGAILAGCSVDGSPL